MRIIGVTLVTLLLWTAVTSVMCQGEKQSESSSSLSVSYNVTCSPRWMIVTVSVNSSTALLYLNMFKDYPPCVPEKKDETYIFKLPLDDIYTCGTTRMINKIFGNKIYYHRVVVEEPSLKEKEIILVKCYIPPTHNTSSLNRIAQNRTRRNSLPDNFIEPEVVNITEYIQASAPFPYLSVAVQQQGRTLDATKGVQPGTPLHMIVYLDRESAGTYGLLMSFLKVTDGTPDQEEVIIMNGCSIDPYIFGNFDADKGGKSLSAKFRAFKFPDTNHVLFVGTVSICLQECRGVPCGNGQLGFGRRKRRAVPTDLPPDPNRMFEVEMTTVLKVQYTEEHFTLKKGSLSGDWLPQKDDSLNSSSTFESHISPAALYTENSALSKSMNTSIFLMLLLLLTYVI